MREGEWPHVERRAAQLPKLTITLPLCPAPLSFVSDFSASLEMRGGGWPHVERRAAQLCKLGFDLAAVPRPLSFVSDFSASLEMRERDGR